MIPIFIGYDPKESGAYHVLSHSIIRRASEPVSISPVRLSHLKDVYHRDPDEKASTEFTFSRFMVPWLCQFEGWAIFMDSDMLCMADIAELWVLRDDRYSVMCVRHEYVPSTETKMQGETQVHYPRKNWSSLMLINCSKCRVLTPDYVNAQNGAHLHRFEWTYANAIGPLPYEWNHLVTEYEYDPGAKIAHFTLGGPWWDEYEDVDYAGLWREEWASLIDERGFNRTRAMSM